jgi:lipopolysaccharide transport system permease protein
MTTAVAAARGAMPRREFDDPSTILIEAADSPFDLQLGSLWSYWELLYFMVWRDVKVRYKQTAIGAAWAILQPVTTMVLFTAVFGGIARIPSDGIPYPIFAFTALLPWTYFSTALSRSGNSLVSNSNLITKVYFPRLIIPVSAVISPLVDFAMSFVLMIAMMVWFRISPGWGVLALPLLVLFCLLAALSVTLWLSALSVRYRDVGMVIPFLVQIWMYASPVAYPLRLVPEKWRFIYSLNPMVGVIEGFRWALLGQAAPPFSLTAASAVGVLVLLYGGLVYFKSMERVFADVV